MKKRILSIVCIIALIVTMMPGVALAYENDAEPSFAVEATMNYGAMGTAVTVHVPADGMNHFYKITVPEDGLYYVASRTANADYIDAINLVTPDDFMLVSGFSYGTYASLTEAWLLAGKNYYVNVSTYEAAKSGATFDVYLNRSPDGKFYLGDAITMTIDDDGIMNVTGTGAMWPFESSIFGCLESNEIPAKEIIIGEGITSVAANVFSQMYYTKKVTLPSTLTSIGEYAFSGCNIKKLELPNALKTIGNNAFSGCDNLETVVLNSIPKFGLCAFNYSKKLNSFVDDSGNEYDFETLTADVPDNQIGIAFGGTAWIKRQNPVKSGVFHGIEYSLRQGVLELTGEGVVPSVYKYSNVYPYDDYCPWDGYRLDKVVVGDCITEVGANAFNINNDIKEVVLGEAVTTIGKEAFAYCSNLTSVTMTSNLTSIGENAFAGNSSLVTINDENEMPWSVSLLEQMSYQGNILKSFSEVPWFVGRMEMSGSFEGTDGTVSWSIKDGTLTIKGKGELDISADSSDTAWMQYSNSVETVVIDEGFTKIGPDFADTVKGVVKYLYLPDSMTEINTSWDSPFYNWSSLKYIKLPAGIKNLPEGLFEMSDFNELEHIDLPANLETIGAESMYSCTALKSIDFPAGVKSIGTWAFYRCSGLGEIVLPSALESIGNLSFAYCSSAKKIVIPQSVTSIGDSAFAECTNVSEVIDENGNPYTLAQLETKLGENVELGRVFMDVPWYIRLKAEETEDNETGTSDGTYTAGPYRQNILTFTPGADAEYTITASVKNQNITVKDADGNTIADTDEGESTLTCMLERGRKYTILIHNPQDKTVTYTVSITGKSSCEDGHVYGVKYIWSDDYENCTIKIRCLAGDDSKEVEVSTSQASIAATCTEPGSIIYTAYYSDERGEFEDSKQITSESPTGHKFGSWTRSKAATCQAKGQEKRTCSLCGVSETRTTVKVDHSFGNWITTEEPTCTADGTAVRYCKWCEDEDFKVIPAPGHKNSSWITVEAATCTDKGIRKKVCSVCNYAAIESIAAKGHVYTETMVEATTTAKGSITKKCANCSQKTVTTISPAKTIKLAASTYTYSGKAKTPAVTVKTAAGKILVKGTDYTVTYATGRKAVGKYKVTVKGKGKYSYTKSLYFKINPKKAVVKSLTPGTKKLTIKMSTKVAATGGATYKIGYKVKGTSTWKYTTTTAQSKIIKNLKKGKRYNIKVQATKQIGKTVYKGSWSIVKTSAAVK